MQASYYALRRFCPYQGMIQVVDIGAARAYSTDGRHWQVRLQNPEARLTPASLNERSSATADDLMRALNERPPLPFPQQDKIELWLLDKQTQLPLALVKTRRSLDDVDAVKEPTWRPFLTTHSGFQCSALEAELAERRARRTLSAAQPSAVAPAEQSIPIPRAQDVLERQINLAARPLPVLQWFERMADGSGIGHGGMRVDERLQARLLPKEAFPELLVAEQWDDATLQALVADYHAWHAVQLLAHQNLSVQTRAKLEQAARRHPVKLLDNYAMYPQVLDPDAMQVALVSAKLIRAG